MTLCGRRQILTHRNRHTGDVPLIHPAIPLFQLRQRSHQLRSEVAGQIRSRGEWRETEAVLSGTHYHSATSHAESEPISRVDALPVWLLPGNDDAVGRGLFAPQTAFSSRRFLLPKEHVRFDLPCSVVLAL